MLSRTLSECQSPALNVLIRVSQFVRNSQLCHYVTKSINLFCIKLKNLQSCNYVQKRRICRENSKYAPDEKFMAIFALAKGCQLLPPCFRTNLLTEVGAAETANNE